jgi:hypothetical protein
VSRQLLTLALVSAIVAFSMVLLGALPAADVIRISLLGVVAVAGAILAGRTLSGFGRLGRSPRWWKRSVKKKTETPPFFERAERRIELANVSEVYFEQLRPRLREIAEQRLSGRGLRLRSEEARELLGPEAWLALEQRAEDKFARPEERRLERVIEALERI